MTVSKKTLGGSAAGLLVVLCLLVSAYFAFLSPKATTVQLTVEHAAMASTQTQHVSGSISPAEAGRLVIVEVGSDGVWTEVARTITDATGVYKADFPMTEKGPHQVLVRVEKDGRAEAVTSTEAAVTVLSTTQLESTIPKFARTDRALRVTGRVGPAATRTVLVEKSTDGQEWTTAGQGASNATSGKFVVKVSDFIAGRVQLRVRVEASATEAETVSPVRRVSVEDYVAAGRRYLQIVERVNKLMDADRELVGSTDLERAKESAARLSAATTTEAKLLRRYAYWPAEVRSQVELLAKWSVLEADFYNQLAHAESFTEYNGLDFPSGPKGAAEAPVFIRAALGLPKRG